MFNKKILFGITFNEKIYNVNNLLYKLKKNNFIVKVLKTDESKKCIASGYWKEFLIKNPDNFDYFVIYSNKSMYIDFLNNKKIDCNDEIIKYIFNNNIKFDIYNPEVYGKNIDIIIEKIKKIFYDKFLTNYNFLITVGELNNILDNNHYIGQYFDFKFLKNIIENISLYGGKVTVLGTENYKDMLFYDNFFCVKNKKEYVDFLNSKIIQYDIIINGFAIPRFSLETGETIKVEYQKYYAEFIENFLPFKEKDILPKNQLILQIFNGYKIDFNNIKYYFENTGIDVIIYNNKVDLNYNILYKNGNKKIYSYENKFECIYKILKESKRMLENE